MAFVSTRTGPRQRATVASQFVRRRNAISGEEIAQVIDRNAEQASDLADRDAPLVHGPGDNLDKALRKQWRPFGSGTLSKTPRGMAVITNVICWYGVRRRFREKFERYEPPHQSRRCDFEAICRCVEL